MRNRKLTKKKFAHLVHDISEYEGKVYVFFSYDFSRGGEHSFYELWNKKDYELMSAKSPVLQLGEVNGKHSDVTLNWRDFFMNAEDDPYDIAKVAKTRELDECIMTYDIQNILNMETEIVMKDLQRQLDLYFADRGQKDSGN